MYLIHEHILPVKLHSGECHNRMPFEDKCNIGSGDGLVPSGIKSPSHYLSYCRASYLPNLNFFKEILKHPRQSKLNTMGVYGVYCSISIYIEGLMQERHNSNSNVQGLHLSCIDPSIYWFVVLVASPMSLWRLWWPPTESSMFMVS